MSPDARVEKKDSGNEAAARAAADSAAREVKAAEGTRVEREQRLEAEQRLSAMQRQLEEQRTRATSYQQQAHEARPAA